MLTKETYNKKRPTRLRGKIKESAKDYTITYKNTAVLKTVINEDHWSPPIQYNWFGNKKISDFQSGLIHSCDSFRSIICNIP